MLGEIGHHDLTWTCDKVYTFLIVTIKYLNFVWAVDKQVFLMLDMFAT